MLVPWHFDPRQTSDTNQQCYKIGRTSRSPQMLVLEKIGEAPARYLLLLLALRQIVYSGITLNLKSKDSTSFKKASGGFGRIESK